MLLHSFFLAINFVFCVEAHTKRWERRRGDFGGEESKCMYVCVYVSECRRSVMLASSIHYYTQIHLHLSQEKEGERNNNHKKGRASEPKKSKMNIQKGVSISQSDT